MSTAILTTKDEEVPAALVYAVCCIRDLKPALYLTSAASISHARSRGSSVGKPIGCIMAASLYLLSEDGETGLFSFLTLKDCVRRSGTKLITILVRPRPGYYFQVLLHHQVGAAKIEVTTVILGQVLNDGGRRGCGRIGHVSVPLPLAPGKVQLSLKTSERERAQICCCVNDITWLRPHLIMLLFVIMPPEKRTSAHTHEVELR